MIYHYQYRKDKVVITNGHILLNFCETTSMRLINGRVGHDKNIGKFTWKTFQLKTGFSN